MDKTSWQAKPTDFPYARLPNNASLLRTPEFSAFGLEFSSVEDVNCEELLDTCEGDLSDTRRNCRTADGLLPKLKSKASGLFMLPERRLLVVRRKLGLKSVPPGVRRMVLVFPFLEGVVGEICMFSIISLG